MRSHNKGISESDAFLEDRRLNNENEIEEEKEIKKSSEINFQQVIDIFNIQCPELPTVLKVTDQRKIQNYMPRFH